MKDKMSLRELPEHASYEDIYDAKEKLIHMLRGEFDRGLSNVDTHEAGQVIDMIKDLAEAEKCCMEACYYKIVIHAMENKEEHDERYYDPRYRYNRVMGYEPSYRDDYDEEPSGMKKIRRISGRDKDLDEARYGKAFNEYRISKKYYTSTNSTAAKEEMNSHANEHMLDTISSIREIWKTADTDLKKRMKADLTSLVGEMTV